VSLDYLIGDLSRTGQGLGPAMIRAMVARTWTDHPDAPCIVIPVSAAIRRVDHRRRPAGGASSARAITRATCSSVIVRGAPGRGASRSPASRSARKRDRHLRTVSRESPSSAATLATGRPPGRSGGPAAHASTILARTAKGPAAGSSAHTASRARSPTVSTTGGDVGLIMPLAYRARMNL